MDCSCEYCSRVVEIQGKIDHYHSVLSDLNNLSVYSSSIQTNLQTMKLNMEVYLKTSTLQTLKNSLNSLDDEMVSVMERAKSRINGIIAGLENEKASAEIAKENYHKEEE